MKRAVDAEFAAEITVEPFPDGDAVHMYLARPACDAASLAH
jgi:hypothetical protein